MMRGVSFGPLRRFNTFVYAKESIGRSSKSVVNHELQPRSASIQQKRNRFFDIRNERPYLITGYYVVFPMIPDENVENNVFLRNIALSEDWPALEQASEKEMYEGTVRLLMEYGASVWNMRKAMGSGQLEKLDFDTILLPLLEEEVDLDYAANTLLLKMLTDWPATDARAFHDDFHHVMLEYRRARFTRAISQQSIRALMEMNENPEEYQLDRWKRRLVELLVDEARAIGNDLTDNKKSMLISSWRKFIQRFHSDYIKNYMCTNEEHVFTMTKDKLKTAPPHIFRRFSRKTDPVNGPWKAFMEPSNIYALMRYCDDRNIRATAWDRWISKASFEHETYNNSVVVEEIRHNNLGFCKVLGFKSVAEHRLCYQMAGSVGTVRSFVEGLVNRIRPVFIDRLDAWGAYAATKEKIAGELKPHDLFYICPKEAHDHYNVDMLDLMNHFPFWPTFENAISIISNILSLEFEDISNSDLEKLHPSVRIYSVKDKTLGEHLGRLYVDPFLGRAVQYLVSRAPYRDLAVPHFGSFAMDFDAADLFPTFIKSIVYKPYSLQTLSSPHQVTGEKLSEKAAEDASFALQRATLWDTYRTLFWTDFDLTVTEMEERRDKFWLDLYKEMYREYFPFPLEKNNYQPSSFMPIFGDELLFGVYYRKLWAEMLALDVHETFSRECDPPRTGERLKNAILYPGAGQRQSVMYNEFQGRDPSIGPICDFYDPPSMSEVENENYANANLT
ncbi:peptidase family m3 domain-containing protein [Ditylenchus destructor]|uniref:Peptidase family m3 domain-containing protein n=1 Tax=Ditylenchus destructor TaxID=166010 RepID=A0AAD4NHJ4_9BILA|nr:peptidase family m3 domain-containing protein [Ditylenchus destructor]